VPEIGVVGAIILVMLAIGALRVILMARGRKDS
jgi:hypothetical protein